MKVNVDKVLERDAKLSELDDRAGGQVFLFINQLSFCTLPLTSKIVWH
jgi:hypothetical protein